MLSVRRILFPTDRSACAERAYAHAAFLARAHDAELHVLHVHPPGTEPASRADLLPLSWHDVLQELRVPSERVAGDLDLASVRERTVEGDNAADGILAAAQELGVDLIVMGTHGKRSADRLLAGSVAERVVREAGCPVLTVRAPADSEGLRRVLVPVDLSDRSKAVIPTALDIARLYGAEVELLFIIDEDTMPMAHMPLLGPVRVSPEEVQNRFRKLMTDLVKEYGGKVPVKGTVRLGHPARDILDYAEAHADLIVMATHGRTGLKRLLMGSVAEKIVRRAPCPVLTLKSFGAEA